MTPVGLAPSQAAPIQTRAWQLSREPPDGVDRHHLRVRYTPKAIPLVTDDGKLIEVLPVDLSVWGMGFLAPVSLIQTTKITLRLNHTDASTSNHRGIVLRCQRHDHGLFHLSVRFSDPCNISLIATLDEPEQMQVEAEMQEADAIRARNQPSPSVFVFHAEVNRRRMLQFRLKDLRWEFIEMDSRGQMHTLLKETPEAIGMVVAFDPDAADASYAVRAARQSGFTKWIIGLGKDDSEQTRSLAERAGCTRYLGGEWTVVQVREALQALNAEESASS